ncbi:hypothetical protein AVEN_83670-1 [Araneus ventricosus]|uniref:Uncharacterized protein n=1 Tax=Araneus ventricosus TaxID=182803 RepID=A0A4Y2EY68_ARAVE|nr:hypothetical protein AVEN_83670-1 [Araneus ventricosus]
MTSIQISCDVQKCGASRTTMNMQIRFALNMHCKVHEHYLSLRFDVSQECLCPNAFKGEAIINSSPSFELGRVVGLREGGFSFLNVTERPGRNVSTMHDC